MLVTSATIAGIALLATRAIAAPVNEKRQGPSGNFGLTVGNEGMFDFETLQTYKLSYANDSAFFGQIKYQQYSEPLVVSGAFVAGDTYGALDFLSEHSAPTGMQAAYITPGLTAPLTFTAPHTGDLAPQGAELTGFKISGGGPLQWNGKNKFYACQSPEQAAINTYQVWWKGGPQLPVGVECKGPINLLQSDACATRTN